MGRRIYLAVLSPHQSSGHRERPRQGRRGSHAYTSHAVPRNALSCREECTTDPAADPESVMPDLAPQWPAESRMSVPGLRFDDIQKRPAPRFIPLGGVASELKRVTAMPPSRVAATTSARRHAGPAQHGDPWPRAPAAAMASLLQAADNPHICSGKSLGSGAARSAAAQLRTRSPASADRS